MLSETWQFLLPVFEVLQWGGNYMQSCTEIFLLLGQNGICTISSCFRVSCWSPHLPVPLPGGRKEHQHGFSVSCSKLLLSSWVKQFLWKVAGPHCAQSCLLASVEMSDRERSSPSLRELRQWEVWRYKFFLEHKQFSFQNPICGWELQVMFRLGWQQ